MSPHSAFLPRFRSIHHAFLPAAGSLSAVPVTNRRTGNSRCLIRAVLLLALLADVPAAGATHARPTRHPEPIVVRVNGGGFHWSDAGIGASAGFGAALMLAGSLALAGGRGRHVAQPPQNKEEQG